VRATFFLLGNRAAMQPELVRRIHTAGHTIGNHSWSHPNLARTRATRVREELKRTNETLQQIIGSPVRYFRPPFGARRPVVFRIARELGLEPVLWNAMTSDWSEPSAVEIAKQLMKKIDGLERRERAANIVLHDGGHRLLAVVAVFLFGSPNDKWKDQHCMQRRSADHPVEPGFHHHRLDARDRPADTVQCERHVDYRNIVV